MKEIRARPVPLPAGLDLTGLGYGSAVVAHPQTQSAFLAAAAGKAAVRCIRVDARGGVEVLPKVRGLVRDGEPEGHDLLWLLVTHGGLHLVDAAANKVLETIREGIRRYPARLTRLDDDHLVVSWIASSNAVVVSTRTLRVVDRFRMPTIDAVISGPPLVLCSFERGVSRAVGPSWRRAGPDRPVPTGFALRAGDRIAIVRTDLVNIATGATFMAPRSVGVVAMVDEHFDVLNERRVDGIERLDDYGDGVLLGATSDAVVALDVETLDEVGRTSSIGLRPSAAMIGPGRAIALAEQFPSLHPQVCLIEW